MQHVIIFLHVALKQKELLSRVRDVVAHGAGAVVSNTVARIMTQEQVRNSLRLKKVMEIAVVMNLVLNRKNTVLVGTADIVGNAGRDFCCYYRWLRESSRLLTI